MPVSDQAFVTLATNDIYCQGALVLGQSLREQGATRALVVLVTRQVSRPLRAVLSRVFDEVVEVSLADSADPVRLAFLRRPELGVTLTKLHCWTLTRYSKCVFLDADTLVLRNVDELFQRRELSAAPDPGWPDCFNSGVFVFRPSLRTHGRLLRHAADHGSFDGADQGLLNSFFSSWATADIDKHLPFTYNLSSNAAYTYSPAFRQFGAGAKVVHFLGPRKPWGYACDPRTGAVPEEGPGAAPPHQAPFLNRWWDVFRRRVLPLYGGARGGGVPGGPRDAVEGPRNVPEGPQNLPERPRNVPEGLKNVPEGPRNVPKGPRNVLEGPRNIPEGLKNVPEGPRTVPEGLKNVPEGPWNVPEGPRNAPEGLENVPEGPRNVVEGPWNVPEGPRNVPEGLKNVPEGLKNVPEGWKNVPEWPRNVPEGPRNVVEGPQNVPEGLKNVPEGPRNIPEGPRNVPEGPQNILEGSRNVPEEPRNVPEGLKNVSEGPRNVMEGPRNLLEGPRNVPKGPRDVPEGLKNVPEGPRNVPEGPRNVVEGPRNVPEGLKNVPEWPRNVPEGPQKIPEGLKNVPEGTRNSPEGPRNLPEGPPWNVPEGPKNVPEGPPWDVPEGPPWRASPGTSTTGRPGLEAPAAVKLQSIIPPPFPRWADVTETQTPPVQLMETVGLAVSVSALAIQEKARALSPEEQRRKWEEGHIDYLGVDAFAYIQAKLDRFLQ